jgi:hypothetical protein
MTLQRAMPMKKLPNSKINESLHEGDLQWLVYDEVMIDMHKTKLGEDKDYIVLAIPCKDKNPANDLASFIEHSTVKFEDVEVSSATDDQGRYLIYVELKRDPNAFETVSKILEDSKRLCKIEQWKFISEKDVQAVEFNLETFGASINTDPTTYGKPAEEIEQAKMEESIKARYKFLLNY